MRRLEYIGGGSQKFWEGARDGTDVVVSWGRLGTAGQSKRKEFDTTDAADEFLAKQVGDKLKKGYVDAGTPQAPAAREEPVATPPAAAPATAEPAPATGKPPVDEDAFDPPPGVVRLAFARRDQGRPKYRPDPDSPRAAAQLLSRYAKQVDHQISHQDTDPRIAEAARRHLGGTPDPVGAAAVLAALGQAVNYHDQDKLDRVAQGWLAEHGLLFAVDATMRLATLTFDNGSYVGRAGMRFAEENQPLPWRWAPSNALADVRAAVATASDDDYAAVVEVLTRLRGNKNTRLLAAFLAPTETAWVDALAEQLDHRGTWLYLGAVYRVEHLAEVTTIGYELRYQGRVLPTLVRTIGPAIAPKLAEWTEGAETDVLRRLLAAIVAMPTDDAFTELLNRVDRPHFRPAVQEAMQRYPVRATRLLAEAVAGGHAIATELLRAHLLSNPELLTDVVPTLPDAAREAAEGTQDGLVRLPDAAPEDLPAVLASPPWTRPRNTAKPLVLLDLPVAAPPLVAWQPGERDKALANRDRIAYYRHKETDVDWKVEVANTSPHNWTFSSLLLHAPLELAEPLMADWAPQWAYGMDEWGLALLARFEVTAVPALLHIVSAGTGKDDLRVLVPALTTEVAAAMTNALAYKKTARPVAKAWLVRHGLAALPYFLPSALDRAGKPREAAETALRALAAQVGEEAVVAESARLAGAEAAAGVTQILATDPLVLLPKKLPAPGAWAIPAALPQIRLRGKEVALSAASTTDVLTMFALGKPDEPYGGVAQVAEACEPASLAAFGWAVFELWRAAGMPPKDGWALTALGAVGDDATVRELAPIIRAWPGGGVHARAVTGLDVLAAIGTDVALMHLNGIAQKVKFGGLKQRAREKIELVAAKLGLTAEQLADRLVPDLGLAADGTLVLDYGPRTFVVGFDEALRPYVSDEGGARRKALPKPGAKDDEDLATASYQRFAGLKKDVRTLASDQITRLERAMVSGRRWTPADFGTYFAAHPLLWHVVRRLVWGVYDESGAVVGAFRLAEDRTLADAEDETYAVPDGATVGVAHPLHLGDALATWAEVFADYEILQPFPQLGRPVLALTGDERNGKLLGRYTDITVNVGKVLGLGKRGWERTAPQDGGVEAGVVKPLPDGWFAVLELEDGIVAGEPTMLGQDQRISRVFLSTDHDGWWGTEEAAFGRLDPVSASELLADLDELVATK